jgi:hypothetical protein
VLCWLDVYFIRPDRASLIAQEAKEDSMSHNDPPQVEMSLKQFGKGINDTILSRVTTIVDALLRCDAGPPNGWERDYKLALLYFLSKSLKTYQAIGCLWMQGFDQDASALSRTLSEMVLQCEWLRVKPREHAVRFQEHAATSSYASFLNVSKIAQSEQMSEAVVMRDKLKAAPEFSAWKAQYEHFASKYNYPPNKVPHNWWGENLAGLVKLLKAAGVSPSYLTEEYYYAYAIESALVHSSALRDQDYVEQYKGGLRLHYYPEDPADASVIVHSSRRILRIVSIVNQVWGLGFDAQIADLLADVDEMLDRNA